MKKKNLTKLMSLTLALATALTLTACGGGGDDSGAGNTSSGTPGGAQSVQETAQGTTLSQYLSGGESIWYLVGGLGITDLGKDTEVKQIFLLEPDGTAYCGEVEDLTLGDLSQMEEAEIADLAREAYQEKVLGEFGGVDSAADLIASVFSRRGMFMEFIDMVYFGEPWEGYIPSSSNPELNRLLDAWGQTAANLAERFPDGELPFDSYALMDIVMDTEELDASGTLETTLESYVYDPSAVEQTAAFCREFTAAANDIVNYLSTYEAAPCQYQLALNTDSTGNETENVTFACSIPSATGDAEIFSFTYRDTAGTPQTVYDVAYGGVGLPGRGAGAFVTRMEGNYYHFSLEQPGTSDLPVDVEPEELFS